MLLLSDSILGSMGITARSLNHMSYQLTGRSTASVALLTGALTAIALGALAMRRRSRAIHTSLVRKLTVDGPALISRVLDCFSLALFDELWGPSVECWLAMKEIEVRNIPKGSTKDNEPTLSVAARFPSICQRLHARQSEVLADFHVTERSLQQAEQWWNQKALAADDTDSPAVLGKFKAITHMLEVEPDRLVEAPESLLDQARAEYPTDASMRDAIRKYREDLPSLKGFDIDSPPTLEDFRILFERKQQPLPITLRARISELVNMGNKTVEEELKELFTPRSASSSSLKRPLQ
ncbi:hypothetical protein Pmar_PMAR007039 [Perkinsus marinus ATCC 50983]|uniref:Uncharacterized protein n=1 Tax=Perkinsus marinus (strain ATCC 50983 / TXsc) TaxID=423536 RepID=C5KZL5_PERM5|nr:hypothetical protein Pmar_PMAR007039 [Perkinsus marinus ATCC 50983]EER10043.1 hypothetical protein Pmar_PMAR007039 [Perkinsus marinus ATCC 50983]|eukprot:XP_002778248.1 hypothetical protein Pmar_PMAR007039 [Perkinsus marinus ATCC 50983]